MYTFDVFALLEILTTRFLNQESPRLCLSNHCLWAGLHFTASTGLRKKSSQQHFLFTPMASGWSASTQYLQPRSGRWSSSSFIKPTCKVHINTYQGFQPTTGKTEQSQNQDFGQCSLELKKKLNIFTSYCP